MIHARAGLIAVVVSVAAIGWSAAAEYDGARVMAPETVLGLAASGPHYKVENPIISDNYFHVFTLSTSYGRFRIEGRPLLNTRLNELTALDRLNRTTQGDAFVRGVGNTIKQPFAFAAKVVTRPAETVTDTLSGIGEAFDRFTSSVSNMGQTPEGPLATITGISDSKREIAARLSIDPYTDFKPLADRLTELGRAIAVGEITVKASMIALPGLIGAAGMMISGTRVADSVRRLVYNKTAAQLRDHNRKVMVQLGVEGAVQQAFLDNPHLTPTDRALILNALAEMKDVRARPLLVAEAARAHNRGRAMFVRQRALLLEAYHRDREPLASFISVGGEVMNETGAGRILHFSPIDNLAWTQSIAQPMRDVTSALERIGRMRGAEIRITGRATPNARSALEDMGWTVSESAGS